MKNLLLLALVLLWSFAGFGQTSANNLVSSLQQISALNKNNSCPRPTAAQARCQALHIKPEYMRPDGPKLDISWSSLKPACLADLKAIGPELHQMVQNALQVPVPPDLPQCHSLRPGQDLANDKEKFFQAYSKWVQCVRGQQLKDLGKEAVADAEIVSAKLLEWKTYEVAYADTLNGAKKFFTGSTYTDFAQKTVPDFFGEKIDGFECLTPERQSEILCELASDTAIAAAAAACTYATKSGCSKALWSHIKNAGSKLMGKFEDKTAASLAAGEEQKIAESLEQDVPPAPAFDQNAAIEQKVKSAQEKIRALPMKDDPNYVKAYMKAIETATPAQRDILVGLRNQMMNKEAWSDYSKKLIEDAATQMRASGKQNLIDEANSGKIERSYVLKVLVQRAKERGRGNLSTLTQLESQSDFHKKLAKGPFFQRGKVYEGEPFVFDNKKYGKLVHGLDSHLVQQDFMSDEIATKWPGGEKEFYEFVGQHPDVWTQLYDRPGMTRNPSSPAYIPIILGGEVPLK